MLCLKLTEHSEHLTAWILGARLAGCRPEAEKVITSCKKGWVWVMGTPSVVSARSMSRSCTDSPHTMSVASTAPLFCQALLMITRQQKGAYATHTDDQRHIMQGMQQAQAEQIALSRAPPPNGKASASPSWYRVTPGLHEGMSTRGSKP